MFLHLYLVNEFGEVTFRVFPEFTRCVKFCYLSVIEYEYTITLYYCLKPVCHNNHCAIFEALLDKFLNDLFGLDIDICSGLVENDNFVFSKDRTADANQ